MIFKHINMNTTFKLTASALMVIFAISCGSSIKENKVEPSDKKGQLEKLKDQQSKINQQVRDLEEELSKTDTAVANAVNAKLVTVTPIAPVKFTHYIDLQGKVDAENISYV